MSCFFLSMQPCFGTNNLNVLSIQKYLNSIHTLSAVLMQISDNGTVSTGQILIKKPKQMRFEYDSPSNHLVIASGLFMVIIDKKSNLEPQRYLTSQTPIGYLLNERIDLARNPVVKNISIKLDRIHIVLADDKKPQSGQLELVFSQKPISLKEWLVTSYSGEETRVLLQNVSINKPLNKKLFDIGHAITNVRRDLIGQ